MAFHPVGRLIRAAAQRAQLVERLAAADAAGVFRAVLSERYGEQSVEGVAVRVRRGELTVTVPSAAMAGELSLNEAALVAAANKKIGRQTISRLRIVIGTRDQG